MDWSSFTLRIVVNSTTEKLYQAWATKSGIESWFLRSAEYQKADGSKRSVEEFVDEGDGYLWRWHGFPDHVNEQRTIVKANGKDQLAFVFSGNCLVTIQLRQMAVGVMVELTQSNIPTDDKGKADFYFGCGTGWTFYLANLKSVMEGGVDLRNKDETITRVINS